MKDKISELLYNELDYIYCCNCKFCFISEEDKENIYILAIFHDLLEDTDVTYEELVEVSGMSEEFLRNQLGVLTKDKNESYIDYIKRLKESGYRWAYIVKLADMKDHLMQKETLTDKLKEKYWEALPELL